MSFLKKLFNFFRKLFTGNLNQGKVNFEATLAARVIYKEGNKFGVAPGTIDKGIICRRCVTAAFVNFLVDKLVAAGNINLFKYHDAGIGTTAENASDTALETPWGGARVSGTQLEGASANIYKSVATIEFTESKAITEHGLFSLAAAGVLCDRSVFSVINVDTNVSIEFTYELTINSGG
jgi:hypothetical protein